MEIELIKLFDNTNCKNIGNEYFQGNYQEMIKCIFNLFSFYGNDKNKIHKITFQKPNLQYKFLGGVTNYQ